MNDGVNVSASFDRKLVSENGDSIRYLLVELQAAPPDAQVDSVASSPLNLALVIDSSRSMVGERLHAALRAAEDIIEGLNSSDFISIVSFSDTALVHARGISCDAAGKQKALEALHTICLRAGTNISEGWFSGAECVGMVMIEHGNCKNHVLMLSDGHANQGTLEPTALLLHATELQKRGVTASAVGVGEGYSTAQLYAIAQHGGGRIHHATHPPEIVEVVLGELDELRARTVENLVVKISFPESVTLKSLNIIPCPVEADHVRCIFGGMSAGSTRAAVFRVGTSAGKLDEKVELRIEASWRNCGQPLLVRAPVCKAELIYANLEKNAMQPINSTTALSLSKSWQSWIVWQATNLNRLKDWARLERLLTRELKYFQRFCRVVPWAMYLLNELEELNKVAHYDWGETSRKEIQTSTYTSSYNIKDSRSGSRKWQDYTGEFKARR
jgi:hypothetical protein